MTEERRASVTADPATSPTLPSWAYTDAVLFEREKSEIFYRSWQYGGWVGRLEKPGDYLTVRLIDANIIIIRGSDGVLRGFHNVCPHRGHELLVGCGRTQSIVCPYHAWSYRTDGGLLSARGAERSGAFDASRFHLKPVKVDVMADKFLFFNLDVSARPLREFTAGLEEDLRVEIADFDSLQQVERVSTADSSSLPRDKIINANWKIVVDNCLECYHCRSVHPAFCRLINMDEWRVRTHEFWASFNGQLNNPEIVPNSARNKNYRFWWLWPNTYIGMAPGGAHGFTIGSQLPVDVARTGLGRDDRYGVPGAPLFEPRGYSLGSGLDAEDLEVMESVQRGMASGGYTSGSFSFDPNHGETSEEAVHLFHWLVTKTLDL